MIMIRAQERDIERCEARLRKEKQFNRKVEINAELIQVASKRTSPER